MDDATPSKGPERTARALGQKLERPVDDALLAEICRRIRETVDIETIILFGSHAYGNPTSDSDIDLLVVAATDENHFNVAARIYGALSPRRVGVDIVVRTPEQIQRTLAGFDPFMREVWKKGKRLYERVGGHKTVAREGG